MSKRCRGNFVKSILYDFLRFCHKLVCSYISTGHLHHYFCIKSNYQLSTALSTTSNRFVFRYKIQLNRCVCRLRILAFQQKRQTDRFLCFSGFKLGCFVRLGIYVKLGTTSTGYLPTRFFW